MTRSHKANDRDHKVLPGTSPTAEQRQQSRFFTKNGFFQQDPNGVKKEGSGRGNWGSMDDELEMEEQFNFNHSRRRSNSHSLLVRDIRTKFDVNDEPVFEEGVHGPVIQSAEDAELDGSDGIAGGNVVDAAPRAIASAGQRRGRMVSADDDADVHHALVKTDTSDSSTSSVA